MAVDSSFHSWKPTFDSFPVNGPLDFSVVRPLRWGRGEGSYNRVAERERTVVRVKIQVFSDAELLGNVFI